MTPPTNLVTLDEAKALLTEKPKRSKYGAVKAVYDGETFDSKGELERWRELLLLEKAGEISNLTRQVRYPLVVAGFHICNYVADFVYVQDGATICEDFKGGNATKTQAYVLKRKLMRAINGIDIYETGKGKR